MKKLLYLSTSLFIAHFSIGQSNQFTARHQDTFTGRFNCGRVVSNLDLSGTGDVAQWNNRGNSGLPGDGRIWAGFSRYKMFERDLYNALVEAGKITWTTGLIQKEKNFAVEPEIGGHDVDWYLALDPNGWIVPQGTEPDFFNAWDWANELGFGWEHTVYVGRVLQSEPMATDEEKDIPNGLIPQDSPAMRITFDVTDAIKAWIDQGLLTENSTIAFGNVQREAVFSDGQGNPDFTDEKLYIHSQMVFEVGTAYLEVEATSKGPGPFSPYDLVDGWVDSEDWLGWVFVEDYPWCYVLDLGKYVYVTDEGGWIYIPN